MCGITGILTFHRRLPLEDLIKASEGIKHRGPDDEGYYVIHNSKLKGVEYKGDLSIEDFQEFDHVKQAKEDFFQFGVAHRRFSILDTSSLGHQPMLSNEKDIILTFNGEIFNFVELRDELLSLGYTFKSSSDTEVVLFAYKEWGVECFDKFNGFWSIAILDLQKNLCLLSRDRFGQKPLYYFENDGAFYFSSEIASLRLVCPEINEVDRKSAYMYLYHDRKDSITSSMYKGLQSLEPCFYMTIDLNNGEKLKKRYWDYPSIDPTNAKKSIEALSEELSEKIRDSIKIRLRSDVPVAANLSGGLDSATIVLHASELLKQSGKKLTTHTFEYKDNRKLSEKREANIIAKHCDTDHEVLLFDSGDVWKDLNELVKRLEEPVHSPAAYIQWLAWKKIADKGYKVILHGSANDELMMGYSYFAEIEDKYTMSKGKLPLRMQGNSIFYYRNILRVCKWVLKREVLFKSELKSKEHPKNEAFNYEFLSSNADNYNEILTMLKDANNGVKRRLADFRFLRIPFWNNFMDKSMMSIPIEVRLPFLDKNVVEFCFKNSSKVFYRKGWTKFLLRNSLKQSLPAKIVWNNRKKGFTSPTSTWLIQNKKTNLKLLKSNSDLEKFVNIDYLEENYDNLNHNLVWRIVNFAIWIDVCKVKI